MAPSKMAPARKWEPRNRPVELHEPLSLAHKEPVQEPRRRATTRQCRAWRLFTWTRQSRDVRQTVEWRPWWLLGLVTVVSHPQYTTRWHVVELPAVRAFAELPAIPRRLLLVAA